MYTGTKNDGRSVILTTFTFTTTITIPFFSPPNQTEGWMDIEDVFSKIGGYGLSQKKIVYIFSSSHSYLCFVILTLTFIGAEPPWSCPASGSQNGPAPQAHEDCVTFERGECSPVYSHEFSSIASEVFNIRSIYTQEFLSQIPRMISWIWLRNFWCLLQSLILALRTKLLEVPQTNVITFKYW